MMSSSIKSKMKFSFFFFLSFFSFQFRIINRNVFFTTTMTYGYADMHCILSCLRKSVGFFCYFSPYYFHQFWFTTCWIHNLDACTIAQCPAHVQLYIPSIAINKTSQNWRWNNYSYFICDYYYYLVLIVTATATL